MVRDAFRSPRRAARLLASVPSDPRCLACGGRVTLDDHVIRIRGDVFHPKCALYRPRVSR